MGSVSSGYECVLGVAGFRSWTCGVYGKAQDLACGRFPFKQVLLLRSCRRLTASSSFAINTSFHTAPIVQKQHTQALGPLQKTQLHMILIIKRSR